MEWMKWINEQSLILMKKKEQTEEGGSDSTKCLHT